MIVKKKSLLGIYSEKSICLDQKRGGGGFPLLTILEKERAQRFNKYSVGFSNKNRCGETGVFVLGKNHLFTLSIQGSWKKLKGLLKFPFLSFFSHI